MSKGPKRRFTREYKEEALRLWEANSGRSKETGEQLGISPAYLPKWRRELQRADRSHPASAGQPVAGSEAAENVRLRRENERLRMERDILKKAAIIFGEARK
jgi:transposase